MAVKDIVSEEEWQLRVDLAALYRLIASYGWDDLVFTHLTARVPGSDCHFLINPYGLLFEEVTASSLVKVDLHGEKVLETPCEINPAGFVVHSAVHEVREDAGCVIHLHTRAGVAVSSQIDGLLAISQQAAIVHSSLCYHDYEGIAVNPDERLRLQADLGGKRFMILRNHGTLVVGETVADAFLLIYVLETACQIQVAAQGGGELLPVDNTIVEGIQQAADLVTRGLGGHLAWPALLRKMDRLDSSFRD